MQSLRRIHYLQHLQDLDQDDHIPETFKQAPPAEVKKLEKEMEERRKEKEKTRRRLLREKGFEGDIPGESIL